MFFFIDKIRNKAFERFKHEYLWTPQRSAPSHCPASGGDAALKTIAATLRARDAAPSTARRSSSYRGIKPPMQGSRQLYRAREIRLPISAIVIFLES
jgi:hypothetical protein